MKITIIDKCHQRGAQPVSRSFDADALINKLVAPHRPELRAASLFSEIRKLLLYCRYDALCASWDNARLLEVEQLTGPMIIEASFPQRYSDPKLLSAALAVEAIDNAMATGCQELSFYVSWIPCCTGHGAKKAVALAEDHLVRSTVPFREAMSFRAQQTYRSLKEISQRFRWERKKFGKTARHGNAWEDLDDNWYGM